MELKIFHGKIGRVANMFKITLTKQEKIKCIEQLIGRVFKILPMTEEINDSISKTNLQLHIEKLIIDMHSANSLFDGILIDIVVKINSIYENDFKHSQIRSIVLDSASKLNKVKSSLEGDADGL